MASALRTSLARRDLEDIARYIAHESQSRATALRFLDSVAVRCELCAVQPGTGERCPDLGENVRRLVIGNYVAFYEPIDDGIVLLRVMHGSRDVPSVWRNRFR